MLMPNVTIANEDHQVLTNIVKKDGGLSLKVFHYLNH